jgi:hypothetical protein
MPTQTTPGMLPSCALDLRRSRYAAIPSNLARQIGTLAGHVWQLRTKDQHPEDSAAQDLFCNTSEASNCNPAKRKKLYSLSAFSADTAITFLRGLRSLSGLGFLVLCRRLARARTNCSSTTTTSAHCNEKRLATHGPQIRSGSGGLGGGASNLARASGLLEDLAGPASLDLVRRGILLAGGERDTTVAGGLDVDRLR